MTASDGRFASCHSFRIFLFSRWRPNWSLSAACRKDTIGERIPLLPDYKSLIRRYYSELWNAWSTTALEELISRDIVFRGSIGTTVNGIEEFKQYVSKIRAAFPDFHNHIEELIGEGDRIVARLTYTGTHQGELFGSPAQKGKSHIRALPSSSFGKARSFRVSCLATGESLKRQIAQT